MLGLFGDINKLTSVDTKVIMLNVFIYIHWARILVSDLPDIHCVRRNVLPFDTKTSHHHCSLEKQQQKITKAFLSQVYDSELTILGTCIACLGHMWSI